MDKTKEDELKRRVDEVLYYQWDPIGVFDEPYARGEYKSYVNTIISILKKEIPDEEIIKEIANELEKIAIIKMGLKGNIEISKTIAERLINHKKAIQDNLF